MKSNLDLQNIKQSAIPLSVSSEKKRNYFLRCLSLILLKNQKEIIRANKKDLKEAKIKKLESSFIERLVLDEKGIKLLILKLKNIEKLQSGLGEIIEKKVSKLGLSLKKLRVPFGVIAVIYESRPEVTVDVAALCIKSGNAAILKGGSEALQTNKVLYRCILNALEMSGFTKQTICFITSSDRKVTNKLIKQHEYIDLVIARGGYNLVKSVLSKSTIPVLAHAAGGARIYVDKSADLSIAKTILVNAKSDKPSACNSLDTILVHKDLANQFIPQIVRLLKRSHVKIIGDRETHKLVSTRIAVVEDWDREFLDLTVTMKVVKSKEEAVTFVNQHSKLHSEGIIATDKKTINYFVNSVDAAALFINCSTRLHDGYVFGLGSEIGIATMKLHARGPVGLKELTTYKWVVYGHGQIRQ